MRFLVHTVGITVAIAIVLATITAATDVAFYFLRICLLE